VTLGPGRVLGIDPGSKRVGVAVSDARRTVATPLEVVARAEDPTVHRRRIAELAAEWDATLLVVGLPRSLDGSIGPAAAGALEEAEALGDATGLPVETYDERFTTVTAEQALRQGGRSASDRRAKVDMVAATVLLQSWLDHRHHLPPDCDPGPEHQ
jgi:putative Holliday junction resolvase